MNKLTLQYIAVQTVNIYSKLQSILFLLLLSLLFQLESNAQCMSPDPAPFSNQAMDWTNISIDGIEGNAEIGLLHYYTGSKIIVYDGRIKVLVENGELVNLYGQNQSLDGTEDFSGFGEFQDLAEGEWVIAYEHQVDGRLGFISFRVEANQIIAHEYGIQAGSDGDGIIAGDCASLVVQLPIELATFDAETKDKVVELNWSTFSELNNMGFELQRSTDSRIFKTIEWIDGKGTSQETNNYQFTDKGVIANISYYYRLKSIDFDGTNHVSKIVVARIKGLYGDNISTLYPNPVISNTTSIQILGEQEELVNIKLYNTIGQEIKNLTYEIQKGINILDINVNHLQSGHYYLILNINDQAYKRSLYITR